MTTKKRIAVLLSGCGVYDGAEIHEATLTLLAIDQAGAEWFCIAPNFNQYQVINHLNGEEMKETRNVLVESARIARGNIRDLKDITPADFDGLAIPGGFGAAKNLTKWAFHGHEGDIDPDVRRIINETLLADKPIAAMCMGPTVVAKALEGTGIKTRLTVGTTDAPSPYDIRAVSDGMEVAGAVAEMVAVNNVNVDSVNKIVSSPCYMMEASISQINEGVQKAVKQLVEWA
ncbi:isoprenoid biosynthesis glyoxalase ElbB [soil metagenome]